MEPLKKSIPEIIKAFKTKLAHVKVTGMNSISTKAIESLMVQPDKSSGGTVRLHDVAQVVSRGRHINVILSEEAVRHDPYQR
jgi:hypothetical protein